MLGEQHTTEATRGAKASSRSGAGLVLRWVHPSGREPTLLGRRKLTIGRSRSCEVPLEGREISRCHAEVLPIGDRLALRDLSSRNGTFVDGERIEARELSPGHVIRAGEWVAVVEDLLPSAELHAHSEFPGTAHVGPGFQRVLGTLGDLSRSKVPILLLGETGTGKDLLARLVHDRSGRTGTFSVVDCANLSPTLAEASLFGYTRGAFTGALRDEIGLLRQADGGTVYLDELGDLTQSLQAKLLRFADTSEVTPVGTSKPFKVDARIVASVRMVAGRSLEEVVRADLLARLQGATISLPALRERIADIPDLLAFFLRDALGGRAPSFDAEFVESVCLERWPGNVREVRSIARHLALKFGPEVVLGHDHLEAAFQQVRPPGPETAPSEAPIADESSHERELREVEQLRAYFEGGRAIVTEAAELLGVGRQRIYALLGRHPDLARLRADATGATSDRGNGGQSR